jgi:hypothetical protein
MPKKRTRRGVGRPKPLAGTRHAAVTRKQFNDLVALLNQRGEIMDDLVRNQEIQFKRLAQLQAEMDLLRRALDKFRELRRGLQ